MTDRRFRFGVVVERAASAEDWAETARIVESMGYSTLLAPDHLDSELAPSAALMAAADATTELRIGSFVFNNDLRHPVIAAREAATLDFLSGGRFELGLGAGRLASDCEPIGRSFDPAGQRVQRLEEAVTIVKSFCSSDTLDFSGRHYSVTGLKRRPAPVQLPHPPILIGGGGKRMLSLAARHADIVGVAPQAKAGTTGFLPKEGARSSFEQKIAWVKNQAGPRYAELEINVLLGMVAVTDSEGRPEPRANALREIAQGPLGAVGSVAQVADQLRERRDQFDISYICVFHKKMTEFAPIVERLAGT